MWLSVHIDNFLRKNASALPRVSATEATGNNRNLPIAEVVPVRGYAPSQKRSKQAKTTPESSKAAPSTSAQSSAQYSAQSSAQAGPPAGTGYSGEAGPSADAGPSAQAESATFQANAGLEGSLVQEID